MAKKSAITLRITGPDGATSESKSTLESLILGSGSGATVKLTDPKVSGLHAMIKVERSGTVSIMDLGSEHGTKLKDRSVRDPVSLSSGDIVRIGASSVTILFGDDTEESVAVTEMVDLGKAEPSHRRAASPSNTKRGRSSVNGPAFFHEPLKADAAPTQDSKTLQVALFWGERLIEVQHFAEGAPVVIGDSKDARFSVFANGIGTAFVLAQAHGAHAHVNVPKDAELFVTTGSDSHKSKEQLRSEGKLKAATGASSADAVELGLNDRARVTLGGLTFVIRFVKPSAAITISTLDDRDFSFFKIVSISLMAFIALVIAMVMTPVGLGSEGDDIFQNPSKYVKMLIRPEKQIALKQLDLSGVKEGQKAKDEESKLGKKDEKREKADPSKKGAPVVDANKREEDRKKVMKAGLLGALGDGAASNVFGPGGLGSGINNALGGLTGGAGIGDAHGVGGMGARGTGPGGGGAGLGLGGLGTKGSGRGLGGHGSIDLGGRGKDTVRVVPGKTTIVGGLSKDLIMKVIRAHQNEIKFCYEKEAQKAPDLAGKVGVLFTIDPAGAVSEANVAETTLNNANAENCILSRIRRWKFPEPQGGGVVTVNFPWIFKPAGDDSAAEE